MSIVFPSWPPAPYSTTDWRDHWLRFEKEFPKSGRPSRLVSHTGVPYIANTTFALPGRETLGSIASNYIHQLETYLKDHHKSLDLPPGWEVVLNDDVGVQAQDVDLMHWLDVWPPIGNPDIGNTPRIASWNLSRNAAHALPATIIMVATEFLDSNGTGETAQFSTGLTVPMLVEETQDGSRVTIGSITAEYPFGHQQSWTTVAVRGHFSNPSERKQTLNALVNGLTGNYSDIDGQIGTSASVRPRSIVREEFWIVSDVHENFVQQPFVIETVAKARGSIERFPNATSYRVFNRIEVTPLSPDEFTFKLLGTETCSLATGVGVGEARTLVQTPPASVLPWPDAEYNWTLRRPTRTDEILDHFRSTVKFSATASKALEFPGFNVRRCPQFVPEDKHDPQPPGDPKIIHIPADKKMPLRSNEFSALSAFYNCSSFFDMLTAYGIDPATFVVRAARDIQIYYRYGITPGPGKDGRTINAQVAFDCNAEDDERPPIRMNLALGELSRWDRPKNSDDKRTWAQPLGIATDKRWILHEFGHYLLAARIGKLEFDFAHSAGDAMAAIACDPDSRLADTRNGVAKSFRGITYPFVFTTRRHDRSPTLGWAWYGELNRSVIEAPVSACDQLKGYLTEQILSSTLFRLYRALGGDTMDGDAPDVYVRKRASFLTLYLLIRAIYAFGQSPSKAEMLELGMEQVSRLQADVLNMVPQPMFSNTMPQPDGWKGGLTHKVVRWAFETQGMFVEDKTATHNGMGKAPDVDIYIQDQRPLSEIVNGSRFTYGPGSYCPVSLDWSDTARWQMPNEIIFGNRGSKIAAECRLRVWFGFVLNADQDWGLVSQIAWLPQFKDKNIADIPAGESRTFSWSQIDTEVAEVQMQAGSGTLVLVLFELTCPDDPANTDPDKNFGVGVGADPTADLPITPRALTDLVANDNNLGLWVIPVP